LGLFGWVHHSWGMILNFALSYPMAAHYSALVFSHRVNELAIKSSYTNPHHQTLPALTRTAP
jgi:hypothetical protein